MPWIQELTLWTQDLYMACLAENNIPHASVGVSSVKSTLRGHTTLSGNGNAPPSLKNHPNRPSVHANLHNADYRRARQRFGDRLARVLLIDLYALLDKEIHARAVTHNVKNPNSGIEANISNIGLNWSNYPWAFNRCIELAAVRNCLVHNDQKWEQGQINRLSALSSYTYPLPQVGQPIELEIAYLFVYKSAVRQILNL